MFERRELRSDAMAVLQSATVMVYDHSELGAHTSKKCYSLGRMLSDLSSRDLLEQKRDRIEGNAGTELSLEGRVRSVVVA